MNDQIKFNRNTSLLLFSIAICTKLIALPEILFLIIGLRWVYNRVSVKKVFVELNIIISPLYLYGLIMFFIGGVNEYLKALGLFIFNYLSDPIDKISSGGLFDVLFVRVAIVLIACIIISINMKSKIYKFLAFWTLVNFLLSTITWKAYPHYLQQLLIPSCILLFGLLIYLTTFQYKSLNLTLLLIKLHIMLYIFVLTCIYPVISTYGIVSYEIQYIRQSWLNDFSFVKNRLEYSLSDIQEYNSLINDDIKNEYFWLLLKNPMDLYYNKQLKLALPFYMPVNSIYQNTSTLLSILRKKEHIFIMLEKEFKVDIPPLIKQVCSLNGQNTKFELYSCKF